MAASPKHSAIDAILRPTHPANPEPNSFERARIERAKAEHRLKDKVVAKMTLKEARKDPKMKLLINDFRHDHLDRKRMMHEYADKYNMDYKEVLVAMDRESKSNKVKREIAKMRVMKLIRHFGLEP